MNTEILERLQRPVAWKDKDLKAEEELIKIFKEHGTIQREQKGLGTLLVVRHPAVPDFEVQAEFWSEIRIIPRYKIYDICYFFCVVNDDEDSLQKHITGWDWSPDLPSLYSPDFMAHEWMKKRKYIDVTYPDANEYIQFANGEVRLGEYLFGKDYYALVVKKDKV